MLNLQWVFFYKEGRYESLKEAELRGLGKHLIEPKGLEIAFGMLQQKQPPSRLQDPPHFQQGLLWMLENAH